VISANLNQPRPARFRQFLTVGKRDYIIGL
jgi:hypothetical protein